MTAYFQELAASFAHPVTAIAQILGFIPVFLGFFIFGKLLLQHICNTLAEKSVLQQKE